MNWRFTRPGMISFKKGEPFCFITLIQHYLLDTVEPVRAIARTFANSSSVLFIGRHVGYPVALEGALKLKEISYIHAEGYPAAEMKHGPIALIEKGLPVVVVAPYDELFEKTISNVEEVRARGAEVILISDDAGIKAAGRRADH